MIHRKSTLFAAILGAWTLEAIFSASQNYVARAYSSRIPWTQALAYASIDAYPWALLTPLAFLIAGRLVVRRANWYWTLPVLAMAGVAIGALHLAVFLNLLPLIGYKLTPRFVGTLVMGKLHSEALTCWTLFGIRHGIEYYRQYRLRELKASQLEAKLAVAQVEMLKMQLQPHFLFNTLHAISALMYRDVECADRMVTRLSDFLRLTLDSAGVQEVALKREMEYLDKYVEIEQVRFGERLRIHCDIDPRAFDLLVPNLVLQPLVENAVRHGIAPRAPGGRIDVSARLDRDTLIIEVCDDGPGSESIREGVGISNTRARLAHLYGPAATLELGNVPAGFRARLRIPAHASPDR